MNEFELRRSLSGLPAEREPSRDLWPGIAARIGAAPRVRRRWQRWLPALAATLAAVALLSPWLRPDLASQPGPSFQQTLVQSEAESLAAEFQGALRALGPVEFPPQLHPTVSSLDRDLAALHQALRSEPEATFLLEHLRRTYAQRLRLSQRAVTG